MSLPSFQRLNRPLVWSQSIDTCARVIGAENVYFCLWVQPSGIDQRGTQTVVVAEMTTPVARICFLIALRARKQSGPV